MLKQNGTINAQYPFRLLGGGVVSGARTMWGRTERANQYSSVGLTDNRSAIPNGHLAPSAWLLPQVAGGLSSFNNVAGTGTVSANILAVRLAEADLTGSGDLEAVGSLIVQLLADLVGSGEVSDADIKAFLQLAANIAGSGEVSDAELTGLGALVAALLGDGTAANSILTGNGAMAANLVVTGTGLTTTNIGQAVWSAIAAANNAPGTMGEKLNSVGASSNPWDEVIESGFTAAEVLRILMAVSAGDAEGLNSNAVVFKSLDGTKNRVEATQANGNRTIDAIDAT